MSRVAEPVIACVPPHGAQTASQTAALEALVVLIGRLRWSTCTIHVCPPLTSATGIST